eukprot:COSAG02_NODE_56541_length_285_cov_0.715054_1_plen_75_part_10
MIVDTVQEVLYPELEAKFADLELPSIVAKRVKATMFLMTEQMVRKQIHDLIVFFKQKTAYEIMSGDWSSDVCSSD